jgi:hypothetical protein
MLKLGTCYIIPYEGELFMKWHHSYKEQKFLWFSTIFEKEKLRDLVKKFATFVFLFMALYGIGTLIPEGFDWIHYYKPGISYPIWTPWMNPIIKLISPLGFGFVFALTILGISIRSFKYKRSAIPILLAICSLPTLWVLFMGNIDGLILFGMLLMPPAVPLVLMKPQISAFSLLAKRKWLFAGVIWVIISFIIWGFWPERLLLVTTSTWKAEWVQDISLFPWGMWLGLPLLYFSRGDQDLLMAAGSLMTPHLFPYHFIILMPSLARMKWYWMLITYLVSCTPFLANWLGPDAWHFGNLLSICFWLGIFLNKPGKIPPTIRSFRDLFNDNQT